MKLVLLYHLILLTSGFGVSPGPEVHVFTERTTQVQRIRVGDFVVVRLGFRDPIDPRARWTLAGSHSIDGFISLPLPVHSESRMYGGLDLLDDTLPGGPRRLRFRARHEGRYVLVCRNIYLRDGLGDHWTDHYIFIDID
jgi:hypothetical protein